MVITDQQPNLLPEQLDLPHLIQITVQRIIQHRTPHQTFDLQQYNYFDRRNLPTYTDEITHFDTQEALIKYYPPSWNYGTYHYPHAEIRIKPQPIAKLLQQQTHYTFDAQQPFQWYQPYPCSLTAK